MFGRGKKLPIFTLYVSTNKGGGGERSEESTYVNIALQNCYNQNYFEFYSKFILLKIHKTRCNKMKILEKTVILLIFFYGCVFCYEVIKKIHYKTFRTNLINVMI